MCGIAGIWSKDRRPISKSQLRLMLKTMAHRGPDAEGSWNAPGLAFGHKRLKIIDLSDDANQPFTDGKDALVFNGEIFNFQSIRKELESRFIFRTQSDTEVLFRALQVWDETALKKIDGQFAFAYYRTETQTLMLARDHVGICPLYTLETDTELIFASEIKPIITIKQCALNRQGVVDYFTYRYNIQNERTLFDGIKRFPPAHVLKIDLRSRHKETRRYWRLEFQTGKRSPEEIESEFESIMDAEIDAQRIADVPVGIYLSGGIDSGALLRGYSKAAPHVKAFTLQFSQSDNEHGQVQKLAESNTFQQNLLDFSFKDLDKIEDVVFSLEEPFADLIICANYCLAENASKHAKVVLTGEGGDEAFLGYDHQRAFLKLWEFSSSKIKKRFLDILLRTLPPSLFGHLQSYPGIFGHTEMNRIRKIARNISNPVDAYLQLITLFSREELIKLFSEEFQQEAVIRPDRAPIENIFASESEVWRASMRTEVEQLTLIINLLKQDRMGMRFSLEGRVPFVSRSVLNFAASLPYTVQYSRVNKRLLLDYSKRKNVKKKPFSLFGSQMYVKKLILLMDEYVTRETIAESRVLSWAEVQRLRSELSTGHMLIVKRAMAVLIFMVWWKCFSKSMRI